MAGFFSVRSWSTDSPSGGATCPLITAIQWSSPGGFVSSDIVGMSHPPSSFGG